MFFYWLGTHFADDLATHIYCHPCMLIVITDLVGWKRKLLSHGQLFVTHRLYSPWNSPGQNTGAGSLSLLQGIFPNQESNTGLPHCRQILNQLRHRERPRILEWVAHPFSRGSSWPRNQTGVSCIAAKFFTNWAIREALSLI